MSGKWFLDMTPLRRVGNPGSKQERGYVPKVTKSKRDTGMPKLSPKHVCYHIAQTVEKELIIQEILAQPELCGCFGPRLDPPWSDQSLAPVRKALILAKINFRLLAAQVP